MLSSPKLDEPTPEPIDSPLQPRNKTKTIVLYNPNPLSEYRKEMQTPLALLAISRLLCEDGYDVKIISDGLDSNPYDKVVEAAEDAICLGISCMTGYQITDGSRVAKLIRSKYPDIPIVWGGWHPSMEPDQTLESPLVDYIVRGQGERTFYELVKCIEEGGDLKEIKGLSFKNADKVIHTRERPFEDVNNFPRHPYHLVNVEKSLYTTEYGNRVMNFVSSTGCPFRCSFCEEQAVYKRRWAGLEPKRLVDEIEFLIDNYGIDGIAFHDSNFFIDKVRVKEFCEEMIRRGLQHRIKWGNANGRTRQLSSYEDEIWELMRNSGLRLLLTGAESGDQEMLDFIYKDQTVEDTFTFADKCEKFEIKAIYSFFFGIPWDKDLDKTRRLIHREFNSTMAVIEKLTPLSRKGLARVILSNFTPYPGSPLFYKALEIGFEPPKTFEGWSGYLLEKNTTDWMPPELGNLTEFLTTYVFVFLDTSHYDWLSNRIENRFTRVTFRLFYKLFERIVMFRWKRKFWGFKIDFKIYQFIKDHSGSLSSI